MHCCVARSRSADVGLSWAGLAARTLAAVTGLLFLCTSAAARETPDRDPVEPPSGATSFQTRALHGWRHHAGPNWAVGLGQVFHVWRRDDMVPGIRAQLDIVMGQGLGPIYLMLVPTAGLSWSCSPGPSSRSVARSSD